MYRDFLKKVQNKYCVASGLRYDKSIGSTSTFQRTPFCILFRVSHSRNSLKELFKAHQGLLIAAPEYNSSITAVLKNTIDWVSRPVPNEAPLAGFAGKAAVIMAASPGQLGGLRGLVTVRSILGNIKVTMLPDQIAIPKAHEAFDAAGTLKDPKLQESVSQLGAALARFLAKLHG